MLNFAARYDRRLLGGVVALDCTLLVQPRGDWDGQLYREAADVQTRPVKITIDPLLCLGQPRQIRNERLAATAINEKNFRQSKP